ncbi:phosphoribosyltransferase [Dethiosulfovibrio peptidovorans DSM 11002]|uniref:Phosphoribosyltransferase n=1 Tax=Dethiosulfovibrio peptidovorans DSM 11002 TaxID=469381 RepID=D2Z4M4_9BACT|nr:phosphoribosyltransferase family protein [Dethiosulfovibrio peptidovorans]EFC92368.1 phosphoribosyltransferase [Dethiosulfovibrio peptidovorans DSM 11002]
MKGQRTGRLIRIVSKLLTCPSRQFSVTSLADDFDVSKTVVSDDVSIIDEALQAEGLGRVRVDRGRSGGAFFVPQVSRARREVFLARLADVLSKEDRILPSGLIYYSDILFNPKFTWELGLILASDFYDIRPDVVMTSEVKGIPLGMSTAQALGVPLAVCRFRNRASDGPAVCVHFATQTGDVRAMYMGTKQICQGSRVLVIDDFMRGGSTASGMCQVVREFKAELVGIGVFLAALEPRKKAIESYSALLRLDMSGEGARVSISG